MTLSLSEALVAPRLSVEFTRIVVSEPCGSYTAYFKEFPGCMATGDSMSEALSEVESVAIDWIEAVLSMGQTIPSPEKR